MTKEFDPVIEAALIQAAAALAVEASAFTERNLRATSSVVGPSGLPEIEDDKDKQPNDALVSAFAGMLPEVREVYRQHVIAPRLPVQGRKTP
ncbi:hypothetical protein NKW53_05945 [Acetobacter orientalis]|uniref:hypothetical protein n=1 Tax=Acetobacter orientalis TaxID=146474 RepID=UPI00209CBA5C|nr:hypothetical protein [Acetobacter orientalis]MCP1215608.1 hypothetical protein [Acetobacter orientalis]MCP1217539.1 hypothetical protein [Acetobacter orientalis]